MAYGTVKVDNITFDNGGSDQNVTVSGLYRATTSGVTLSGTIAATTVSGVTVIGSTTVSGATVTGTTANFTSGNFSNIISSAATMSGSLIMANQQQVQFREAVGNGVNHIALQAPAIVSADQTITLPDQTGTVITTGDNGSVSSTMLATNLTISAAAGSASTPSIAFTGDLNTGIYSPGADQLAVSTGGTGRLFVDSSGNVLNFSQAARTNLRNNVSTLTPGVQLEGVNAAGSSLSITRSSNDTSQPHLVFLKSRGTTVGANDLVTSGDGLAGIFFNASDGTVPKCSAYIRAIVDGTPSAGAIPPSRLVFAVTQSGDVTRDRYTINADGSHIFNAGGSGNPERLRIDSSGNVGIGTSSPGEKLDVSSGGAGAAAVVKIQDPAGRVVQIASPSASTQAYIGTTTGHRFDFLTNNTIRATFGSNGNLGIGTSSPARPLDVTPSSVNAVAARFGNVAGRGLEISTFLTQTVNDAGVAFNALGAGVGAIAFQTDSTERLRIDSSGRVGIGTSSPGQKLDVSGVIRGGDVNSTTGSLILEGVYSGSDVINTFGSQHSSGATVIGYAVRPRNGTTGYTSTAGNSSFSRGAIEVGGTDTAIKVLYAGASTTPIGNVIAMSEAMRIDSSGRVGIGTSAPAAKTEIVTTTNGDGLRLSYDNTPVGGNGAALVFTNKNNASTLFPIASVKGIITNGAVGGEGGGLTFNTAIGGAAVTERMRIGSDGTVTTFGSATDAFVSRSSSSAGTTNYNIRCTYSATGTLDGAVAFQVSTNGNVTNTNNSYGAISDIRLKENIVDANSQWDDIKALQVRNYNFKEGQTHTQIGIVAQETELISPGLVTESPDRDEEGNDLGTVTKSVNYSVLYMKAVKALQEAMERIETLEAAVAALQSA